VLEFESSAGRPLSGVEHSSERTREGGWPRTDCGRRRGCEARSCAPVRVPRAGVEGRGAGLADRGGGAAPPRAVVLASRESPLQSRVTGGTGGTEEGGERGVLGQVCVGQKKY
jgi:hypothetical protein